MSSESSDTCTVLAVKHDADHNTFGRASHEPLAQYPAGVTLELSGRSSGGSVGRVGSRENVHWSWVPSPRDLTPR